MNLNPRPSRLSGLTQAARCGLLLTTLLLTACDTGAAVVPTIPAVQPKLLVTVEISPTPDVTQQSATRAAVIPSATPPPATQAATATAYVGVFIGEAENASDGPSMNTVLAGNSGQLPPPPITETPGCPAQPDPVFGTRWNSDPAIAAQIGCPIEQVNSASGKMQVFERGVMYARANGEVWAMSPADQRYWYYAIQLPPPPNPVTAPDGLFVPSQTFLTIWVSVSGLSDAIGFARTEESDTPLSTQKFQGGQLLADGLSGQVFVLVGDGITALGPY